METTHEHDAALKNALKHLPKDETLFDLADLFRLFADSTRVRLLYALSHEALCVKELSTLLNAEQSAVSHQLKILRETGLVNYRRAGKTNLYSLADEHVHSILSAGLEHVTEED